MPFHKPKKRDRNKKQKTTKQQNYTIKEEKKSLELFHLVEVNA
jgi:hypothetical protein